MAKWEIVHEGNRTTIEKKHPFWNAFIVFCGFALVLSGVERSPWLIAPTILILGGLIWMRAKGSTKATKNPPAP
jgi:hypothetical protein